MGRKCVDFDICIYCIVWWLSLEVDEEEYSGWEIIDIVFGVGIFLISGFKWNLCVVV